MLEPGVWDADAESGGALNTDLFTTAAPSPTPACPVPVDPPACDCCLPASECANENEPVLVCDQCGEIMERGAAHNCSHLSILDTIVRDYDGAKRVRNDWALRASRIEAAAWAVVKYYVKSDEHNAQFDELMIDLARELAGK